MAARIAVLVPIRNGERDLPGFLASVSAFADLVVALDDGSTDDTRRILEAHPLVRRILTNRVRTDYSGWDDAENRQRLLEALDGLDVDWVVFLDVDERIDGVDAAALSRFVATEAIPGFAYGFLVVSMIGGTETYDAGSGLWVYRMFAYGPGLRLPGRRLHFVPVPVSVPRARWVRTTMRIQHLAGSDEQRRAARFAKYQEADPDRVYQAHYERLLEPPSLVRPWESRAHATPIVVDHETRFKTIADEMGSEIDRPTISAVVIAQNDETTIAQSMQALLSQRLDTGFEVIAVASGTDRTADVIAETFPDVRVIRLPRPVLPGEARNAGLWAARGHYVTFPGSHVTVAPGSLQARVDAHDSGWDLVTGTTLNGNTTRAGWASYFLDHSGNLPGLGSRELRAAPAHCSYVRRDLDLIGGYPEGLRAGEDTVVNQRLFRRGKRAYRAEQAAIVHHSPCRSTRRLLMHHFERGRSWGSILIARSGSRRTLIRRRARSEMVWPWRRIRVVSGNARHLRGALAREFRQSRPLIVGGALAAGLGLWVRIMDPTPVDLDRPTGRTSVAGDGRSARSAVVVAHYGSPAAAGFGLLGLGPRRRAAARVARHADRQAPVVATPALYVLAVAATSMPGPGGTYAWTMSMKALARWVTAARRIDGRLIIGVQPSRQTFVEALAPYAPLLRTGTADVGIDATWRQIEGRSQDEIVDGLARELGETFSWISTTMPSGGSTSAIVHGVPEDVWRDSWRNRDGSGLSVVGLADRVGTLTEKLAALDSLARRAPDVGVLFHLRRDAEAPEPLAMQALRPDVRVIVYR